MAQETGLVWGTGFRGTVAWTRRSRAAAAVATSAAFWSLLTAVATPAADTAVIVRARPGASRAAERLVTGVGGTIQRRIGIIDGFVARVPAPALGRIGADARVASVTVDRRVRLLHTVDGFDGSTDPGSMFRAVRSIKAHTYWNAGITGRGVDVALIDSGVVPVNGLTVPGKVVNGPDLSVESQSEELRYLDTYGHGTHMAGIIAGRADQVVGGKEQSDHDNFLGVAPDTRLVSVKVANALGATDVSQVIAAIDWVVQHRFDNGLNIRVLNLSFGTDGTQDYRVDPLAYAAEVAWRRGIVVVVAAGNAGYGSPTLNDPAYDPFVIAVGAADMKGTDTTNDDTIPEWSSRGDETRHPDVVAPGRSIASLRNPGSHIDQANSEGLINSHLFRGSGTSQAAAMVSGAAALVIQQRPGITPDQVKALLTTTASPLASADTVAQGAGELNLERAKAAPTPSAMQAWAASTGTGSLELARGSAHVVDGSGRVLMGELDIFGAGWDGTTWAPDSWEGTSWDGGWWNGNQWAGESWSWDSWTGNSWSGNSWSGNSWSGNSWSGNSWSGGVWSGNSWSNRF